MTRFTTTMSDDAFEAAMKDVNVQAHKQAREERRAERKAARERAGATTGAIFGGIFATLVAMSEEAAKYTYLDVTVDVDGSVIKATVLADDGTEYTVKGFTQADCEAKLLSIATRMHGLDPAYVRFNWPI